jgi:hypothetical protein
VTQPLGLQVAEAPRISRQPAHQGGKVVSPVHWLPLLPGDIPGTDLYQRPSRPQSHSAARRIKSMKNSSDLNGNKTCDLPACNVVPQPSVPACTPSDRGE